MLDAKVSRLMMLEFYQLGSACKRGKIPIGNFNNGRRTHQNKLGVKGNVSFQTIGFCHFPCSILEEARNDRVRTYFLNDLVILQGQNDIAPKALVRYHAHIKPGRDLLCKHHTEPPIANVKFVFSWRVPELEFPAKSVWPPIKMLWNHHCFVNNPQVIRENMSNGKSSSNIFQASLCSDMFCFRGSHIWSCALFETPHLEA